MCGICGIFDLRGRPVDAQLIRKMSATIAHRGPDGEGNFVEGSIGLGHRRLSIIDLDGGSQPITNEDGSLHIIFNGEIYNFVELREELKKKGHTFKTLSDTEVILHAYEEMGLECMRVLNGIFAFAIWDEKKQRLVLGRDHLGVKPLYYAKVGDRLLFASEIKALLEEPQCPREVNVRALGELFTLRYVASPETLFRDIHKLPPAHWLVADRNGIEVKRYWNWRPQIGSPVDLEQLTETYQSLVEDAVRLQMRSDVPVGLFLSSGIDSGALLAIMAQQSERPVRTFTIGFEGGDQSNETDDARKMASLFGADHTEMIIGPRDYEEYYERYLQDIEEPVGNETAAAFYFVSMIASRRVKVALTGQGADEPWAGYHRYIGARLSQTYSRLPAILTGRLPRIMINRFAKNERLIRGVNSLHEPDILTRLVNIYSFFTPQMKLRLYQPWLIGRISSDGFEARESLRHLQSDVADLDPVSQMVYIDTRANLPDDLLMVGDKTSMANSLEARVPFLDHRIIEFAETLPANLKLRRFQGKFLHKRAVQKWLPKEVVHRKKKGFANPIDNWLRAQMRRFVGDCLLSETAAVTRYFNREYIRELVADHEAGRRNYLRHIYLLISFELWHQKFISA